MIISLLKDCVRLCRNSNITPFIWGRHGLGKSSAVKQLCIELGIGFVDFRASQIESSDLRGLPDRQDGLTVYYPPEELPHGEFLCKLCVAEHGRRRATFGENGSFPILKKFPDVCPKGHTNAGLAEPIIVLNEGMLFLDELNRADDDVLQSSFQLVLDRQIGRYVVPTGWSVVAAGNYQSGYNVNTFNDPAFLDRFCHLKLTPSKEYVGAWSEYMTRFGSVSDRIMQFVGFSSDHLIGKSEGSDLGFTIGPSPRSWEMVARVIGETARDASYSKEAQTEVLGGLVGMELTAQFERFSVEITPNDVLDKGVKAIEAKLQSFDRNQLGGLVWGVSSQARERFKDLKGKDKETMIVNCLDFMEKLATLKDRDLAVMLGRSLVEKETANLGGAVLSNPHLAKMAAKYKGNKTDSWIAAINDRPELQKLMSKVSYGN